MTELLSREREFLKLNDALNKLASNSNANTIDHQQPSKQKHQQSHHQHHQQPQQQLNNSSNSNNNNTMTTNKGVQEQRYYTYTKTKGPSTLLKKRGAGDCGSDAIVDVPLTARQQQQQQQQRNGGTLTIRSDGASRQHGTATPSTARQLRTARTEGDDGAMTNGGSTASSTHRRSMRSPDSSARCYSRTSNRTAPASTNNNNNTFTIKYRNPKFVESPSLEVLIKDESATLRRQSTTRLSNGNGSGTVAAGDAESVTSVGGSSEAASSGGTIVRRSQLACIGSTTKKPLSTEGLIKFLKSKIAILEEDHERISQEMNQQKELMEKTLERHKKVEQQRDQAYAKHNALTEQLAKVESQLEEANSRLKERVSEHSGQQKEMEIVRRELKILTQTNSNLEKRLYRANEELENTKNALTLVKNSERELKEAMRIECDGKDKQIKSLKKQRADLLNAYKKQLFLIDNLKRQNICIEQSKLIGFGEREFTKVLEWNTKT